MTREARSAVRHKTARQLYGHQAGPTAHRRSECDESTAESQYFFDFLSGFQHRTQARQPTVLSNSHRARGHPQSLSGLIRTHADRDPKSEYFSMLCREPVEQGPHLISLLTCECGGFGTW